jgi:hypothetical protein
VTTDQSITWAADPFISLSRRIGREAYRAEWDGRRGVKDGGDGGCGWAINFLRSNKSFTSLAK